MPDRPSETPVGGPARLASGYRRPQRQGRAEVVQLQLPLLPEQLMDLLTASEYLPQALPYSHAVKSAQERMAARRAAGFVLPVPLPSW
jgi:hypothetical protein